MTRRRFLWVGYAVAVVASGAYQTVRPGVPAADGPAVAVPRFDAAGPVPGPPVGVAYQDVGAGPVVVLLHGSPGAVADYRHLLPHLAGFRVLVPDLPGFGKSSRWLPDYSVAAHARYVLAWLDRLGVADFQAVGFSQGGGVALHLADLAPDRVRSVTLCGGIGVQEAEGSGDYYLEHAKYTLMVPALVALPELVPHFGLLGSRSFRWTFFRNFWDTDQRPLRAAIGQLRPPLLVVHGRRDPLVPAWAAVEHHRLHPAGELHLFPDSHFMLFSAEATGRLAAALVPFLGRHRGPDRPPAGSRLVWHAADGPTAPPPDLPARTTWPAAAQVGVPAALTLAAPVGGCLAAGVLAGRDRADPFAAWLGCLAGGLARRLAGGGRAWRPLVRWPPLAVGLVGGAAAFTALVGGWGAVLALAGVGLAYHWAVTRRLGRHPTGPAGFGRGAASSSPGPEAYHQPRREDATGN